MHTWTLENETLHIEVDADTFRCSVMRKRSGLMWAFQDNADGDLRVVHGGMDTLAYLRDAREKQAFHFSTPTEEHLTCHQSPCPRLQLLTFPTSGIPDGWIRSATKHSTLSGRTAPG
jgi:hypothetical protein